MNFDDLAVEYRGLLLNQIMPFWKAHGLDTEYGGVLSCMKEDGTRVSDDKYIWSQARWVWVCAAVYNRVEARIEFLEWAAAGVNFLVAHGRDSEGRWVYRTDRFGNTLEGAISIYSDCFAVYALSEYFRATGDARSLQIALDTFWKILTRVEEPGFAETAPYALPQGLRNHGVPMMIVEVANELAQTTGDPGIETVAHEYADRVLQHFVDADDVVREFLDLQYNQVAAPDGTFVMPGHAIECMWFIMHLANRSGDQKLVNRAAQILKKHLEIGWDETFGGIFLGLDINGEEPLLPHSDAKIWWPHTEALYGLALAAKLTGETWCTEWYRKVHDWAFAHFSMPSGEWRQRLDRAGNPMEALIALPVKDPFHLPRTAILMTELKAI